MGKKVQAEKEKKSEKNETFGNKNFNKKG